MSNSDLFASDLDASACPPYSCKLSSQKFEDKICVFTDTKVIPTAYYAHPCSSDKMCIISTTGNYTCEDKQEATISKWPGEKCDKTEDCNKDYSQECKDSRCVGKLLDEPCTDSNSCNPGLYCGPGGACAEQLKVTGKGCKMDDDCVNNAGCNMTNPIEDNICVQYGTIQPHNYVGTCNGGVSNLCSSGYCFEKEGIYYCSNDLTSIESLPQTCDSLAEPCQSKADKEFFSDAAFATSACTCAKNKEGNLYCGLFNGDIPAVQYNQWLSKWYASEANSKCNTVRRTNPTCIKDFWDASSYHKYYYYYWNNFYYPEIQGAPDCVLEIFYPVYFQAQSDFNSDSSAELLVVSALLLTLS